MNYLMEDYFDYNIEDAFLEGYYDALLESTKQERHEYKMENDRNYRLKYIAKQNAKKEKAFNKEYKRYKKKGGGLDPEGYKDKDKRDYEKYVDNGGKLGFTAWKLEKAKAKAKAKAKTKATDTINSTKNTINSAKSKINNSIEKRKAKSDEKYGLKIEQQKAKIAIDNAKANKDRSSSAIKFEKAIAARLENEINAENRARAKEEAAAAAAAAKKKSKKFF